ncbi:hypothetical protein NQ317_015889 [Molorchus minor]|uniref:Uncharacterized protein n=1 Tax=Molorchus minor TaxID=1323400 RepID=A0ABQ9IY34_9CUCU|nr:hypothetical protein NQ317_015889 [Molorchus minor]
MSSSCGVIILSPKKRDKKVLIDSNISTGKETILARRTGLDCNNFFNCKNQCLSAFFVEDFNFCITKINGFSTKDEKDMYLQQLMEKAPVKKHRPRKKDSVPREYAFKRPWEKSSRCRINCTCTKEAKKFHNKMSQIRQLRETQDDVTVLTFDFMQNLPLPHISIQEIFYLRQLWVNCFGVKNLKTNETVFYVFHEGVANKGIRGHSFSPIDQDFDTKKDKLAVRLCQNIKRVRTRVSPNIINDYFDNLQETLKDIPPDTYHQL